MKGLSVTLAYVILFGTAREGVDTLANSFSS
jgi:hypothetical protein